ncbi:hypothetical protein [Endozoicomonas sp. Mp262]|uniref:hypothetical protein n=1 Tax=Endozoicomonas sp. Mp262 TaxID=2919499 RepID=UPI0021DB5632
MFYYYQKTFYILLVSLIIYSNTYAAGYLLGVDNDWRTIELIVSKEGGETKLFPTNICVDEMNFVYIGKHFFLPKDRPQTSVPYMDFDLVLFKKTKCVDRFRLKRPSQIGLHETSPFEEGFNSHFQNLTLASDPRFLQMNTLLLKKSPLFLYNALEHDLLSTTDIILTLNLQAIDRTFTYTTAISSCIPIVLENRNVQLILQQFQMQQFQMQQLQMQQLQMQQYISAILQLQYVNQQAPKHMPPQLEGTIFPLGVPTPNQTLRGTGGAVFR